MLSWHRNINVIVQFNSVQIKRVCVVRVSCFICLHFLLVVIKCSWFFFVYGRSLLQHRWRCWKSSCKTREELVRKKKRTLIDLSCKLKIDSRGENYVYTRIRGHSGHMLAENRQLEIRKTWPELWSSTFVACSPRDLCSEMVIWFADPSKLKFFYLHPVNSGGRKKRKHHWSSAQDVLFYLYLYLIIIRI